MSVVTDGSGEAVVFHHGTSRRFDLFDRTFVGTGMTDSDEPEQGFFFTPDRSFASRYAEGPHAAIVVANLDVDRPYRVTGEMWGHATGLSPQEAHEAGYDAYVISPYDEGDMWIVFDPSRIRQIARESVESHASTDRQTVAGIVSVVG